MNVTTVRVNVGRVNQKLSQAEPTNRVVDVSTAILVNPQHRPVNHINLHLCINPTNHVIRHEYQYVIQ